MGTLRCWSQPPSVAIDTGRCPASAGRCHPYGHSEGNPASLSSSGDHPRQAKHQLRAGCVARVRWRSVPVRESCPTASSTRPYTQRAQHCDHYAGWYISPAVLTRALSVMPGSCMQAPDGALGMAITFQASATLPWTTED